jgi:hypothetical protein
LNEYRNYFSCISINNRRIYLCLNIIFWRNTQNLICLELKVDVWRKQWALINNYALKLHMKRLSLHSQTNNSIHTKYVERNALAENTFMLFAQFRNSLSENKLQVNLCEIFKILRAFIMKRVFCGVASYRLVHSYKFTVEDNDFVFRWTGLPWRWMYYGRSKRLLLFTRRQGATSQLLMDLQKTYK